MLDGDEWAPLVPAVIFAYNATVNRMTGYSPFEIIFGRSPKFPIDLALNLVVNNIKCTGHVRDYIQTLADHQRAIYLKANKTQDNYDSRRKRQYDKRVKKDNNSEHFEVGDYVTVFREGLVGKKRKFTPKWNGIWKIVEMYDRHAARVKEVLTKEERKVNVTKLKRIHWVVDQQM
jgi:hypothetical protein